MKLGILHFDPTQLLTTFEQELNSTLLKLLILASKKLLQLVFDVLF